MKHDDLSALNSDLDPTAHEEDSEPDTKDGLLAASKALIDAIKTGDAQAVADALTSAMSLCDPDDGEEDDKMPMPEDDHKGKGLLIIASPKKG
jgi:hypothetical protein